MATPKINEKPASETSDETDNETEVPEVVPESKPKPAKGESVAASAAERELTDFVTEMAEFVGFEKGKKKATSILEPPPITTDTKEEKPEVERCPCPICYMNPEFMGHS